MNSLSKRLEAIYNLTPYGVSADVGADHGKLILSLVEDEKIPSGFAIENKIGPYNRLKEAILLSKDKDKVTCLLSDGIKDIDDTVKNVIIAGMGGTLIVNILFNNINKLNNVDYLLIDAHNALPLVREKITSIGYFIDEEIIVYEEDIYYEIIRFKKGQKVYNSLDYDFGPILRTRKDELFLQKWNEEIKKIDNLLSLDLPIKRKEELYKQKERILKVL